MKKWLFSFLLLIIGIAVFVLSCKKQEYKDTDCSATQHLFAANIRPIINASCATAGCHAAGSGNGDFSTYSGIKSMVDAGKFDKAVLYKQNMPPSGPLPKDERQKIYCWIEDGAQNN